MKNPLQESAMLVRLTRKKPNPNCHDQNQTNDLSARLNVKMKNGVRVMKTLFSKDYVKGWTGILNEAGKYYYNVTLPWLDNGYRLLPSKVFDKFSEEFRVFTTRLNSAVQTAADKFEDEINRAEIELGKAFNRSDYPSIEEFKNTFELKVEYQPIPDGDDFRANISEHQKQAIIAQINSDNEARSKQANEYLFNRLYSVIEDLATTLADPTAVYRDTKVSNVIDLCDILPELNVHGDARLNKLAVDIKALVRNIDPDENRRDLQKRAKNANVAAKAADEVKAVMDNMDGYM